MRKHTGRNVYEDYLRQLMFINYQNLTEFSFPFFMSILISPTTLYDYYGPHNDLINRSFTH